MAVGLGEEGGSPTGSPLRPSVTQGHPGDVHRRGRRDPPGGLGSTERRAPGGRGACLRAGRVDALPGPLQVCGNSATISSR